MQNQLLYIGVSRTSTTIQSGRQVTGYTWGSYGAWTNYAKPVTAKNVKVKYDEKKKSVAGTSVTGWANGGVTKLGTTIPSKAYRTVTIDGVSDTIYANVRYQSRGYTIYDRPKSLKVGKKANWKMWKKVYNTSKPMQYRVQYQDSPIFSAAYTTFDSGFQYLYFANSFYNTSTKKWQATTGKLLHPQKFDITISDVRRNLESSTNNSDGRDNSGTNVIKIVRPNIHTLDLEWQGLSAEHGHDLLSVLNPQSTKKYLIVQYLNPATGNVMTKNFIPGDRKVSYYPNGSFKSISVTLTEV